MKLNKLIEINLFNIKWKQKRFLNKSWKTLLMLLMKTKLFRDIFSSLFTKVAIISIRELFAILSKLTETLNKHQITLKISTHLSLKMDISIDIKLNLNLSITVRKNIIASTVPLMDKKANKFITKIHKIPWNFIKKKAGYLSLWIKMDGWIKQLNWWVSREMTKADNFQTRTKIKEFYN